MRSILCLAALLSFIGCTHDVTDPADAGAPSLLVVSGGGQSGVAGTELPQPLVIKATRANGGPIVNVAVNFHVTSGGGSMFAGTALTDARGVAQDYWTLGTSTAEPQRVEVRAVLSGGEKEVFGTFAATARPGPAARIAIHAGDGQTAPAATPVPIAPSVRVSDQYDNPVPGVAVAFAALSGGGSVTGANPTTDAGGIATAGSWTLGAAGANTVTATAAGTGIAGNPVTFSATATVTAAPLAWTQLAPTGGPPEPRNGHSAVLAPSNTMIVFGGFRNGIGYVNDLWLLSHANGNGGTPTWMAVTPGGTPPPVRAYHSAVYDIASDRMIVFGGCCTGSGPLGDTWVLVNASGADGTPTWIQLQPAGGLPAARFYHSAVYDAATNRMIVFGGGNFFGAANIYDEVWVLTNANGLGGTPTWTQLTPTGDPGGRYLHTAVYDPATNRMMVFAGENLSVRLNDVWVLANANGAGATPSWSALAPSGAAPPERNSATAVYDPASVRMTIFGGFENFGIDNQTWVLTGANGAAGTSATWLQMTPAGPLPPPRYSHSAVFDPVANRMIVFGGNDLNDTWVLADANGSP